MIERKDEYRKCLELQMIEQKNKKARPESTQQPHYKKIFQKILMVIIQDSNEETVINKKMIKKSYKKHNCKQHLKTK